MQWQVLAFSMLPVIVFAFVRPRADLAVAIHAAIATALLEWLVNTVRLGFVEPFSLASLLLFVVLGVWARKREKEWLFKLQPAVLEVGIAATIAWFTIVEDVPLLARIVTEHLGFEEVVAPYQRGYVRVYATNLSRSAPFVLVFHAILTAWTALEMPTWLWATVRVVGFYVLFGLVFVIERLSVISA